MPLLSSVNKFSHPAFFFLKQYLLKPSGIGAIAPSSKNLARLIVESLALHPDDVVVELGPGTGVFTRQLLARGVRPENLILVETNMQFVCFLKDEFPGLRVIAGDAQDLPQILHSLGLKQVDKIVSGIPMRAVKPQARARITMAVAAALKPGGVLAQFSYFNIRPLPEPIAAEAGLAGRRSGVVMGNLPPAFIWWYRKIADAGGGRCAENNGATGSLSRFG